MPFWLVVLVVLLSLVVAVVDLLICVGLSTSILTLMLALFCEGTLVGEFPSRDRSLLEDNLLLECESIICCASCNLGDRLLLGTKIMEVFELEMEVESSLVLSWIYWQ